MFGLLIPIVVLVVIVALARRGRTSPPPRATQATAPSTLERAVAAGILTAAQADALLALVPPEQERAPRRVSVTAEVLGYVGAVLAMVGVGTLVGQFWDDLATWARLALVAAAAAGFAAGGAALREEADPALWRLRGFLWLLSSGALAFFCGMVGTDVLDWAPEAVALGTGAVVAAQAALLWRRRDRPAQQLACAGGLVAAVAGAGAWVEGAAAAGLGIALLGGVWAWLGWRKLLPPELVATTLGAALVLAGTGVTGGSWPDAAPLLGLASAFGLIAVGSRAREFTFTGLGVIGTFIYLPMAATQFFADTIGVPIVLLVTGGALLAVALVLLRREGPLSGSPPKPA